MQTNCTDTTLLGSFSENHDEGRFASLTSDFSLARNVIAFNFLSDGIPIMYQGQEQHLNGSFNPINREAIWLTSYNTSAPLYGFTRKMNAFRKYISSADPSYLTNVNRVVDLPPSSSDFPNNTMAMQKGNVTTVLSNLGSNSTNTTITLFSNATGYGIGTVITDVISCTNRTVGKDGVLSVVVSGGMPVVLYPALEVGGTRYCFAAPVYGSDTTGSGDDGSGGAGSGSGSGDGSDDSGGGLSGGAIAGIVVGVVVGVALVAAAFAWFFWKRRQGQRGVGSAGAGGGGVGGKEGGGLGSTESVS